MSREKKNPNVYYRDENFFCIHKTEAAEEESSAMVRYSNVLFGEKYQRKVQKGLTMFSCTNQIFHFHFIEVKY